MSFLDLADRGVKNKADAVALALFRYRCICTNAVAAVQSLMTDCHSCFEAYLWT